MATRANLSAYLPHDLLEWLKNDADQSHRSISRQVEYHLDFCRRLSQGIIAPSHLWILDIISKMVED
jgi:hypothetical protein